VPRVFRDRPKGARISPPRVARPRTRSRLNCRTVAWNELERVDCRSPRAQAKRPSTGRRAAPAPGKLYATGHGRRRLEHA
jgi:hypothetical protein